MLRYVFATTYPMGKENACQKRKKVLFIINFRRQLYLKVTKRRLKRWKAPSLRWK